MKRCSFTPLAKLDVQEISSYIALRDLDAANRVTNRIVHTCQSLVNMPERGRLRNDLLPGLRSVIEGKYIIFYFVVSDGVQIYRILHGARQIERLLPDELH